MVYFGQGTLIVFPFNSLAIMSLETRLHLAFAITLFIVTGPEPKMSRDYGMPCSELMQWGGALSCLNLMCQALLSQHGRLYPF